MLQFPIVLYSSRLAKRKGMPSHDQIISIIKARAIYNQHTSNVSCSYVPNQLCTAHGDFYNERHGNGPNSLSLPCYLIGRAYYSILQRLAPILWAQVTWIAYTLCMTCSFAEPIFIFAVAAATIVVIMAGASLCALLPPHKVMQLGRFFDKG